MKYTIDPKIAEKAVKETVHVIETPKWPIYFPFELSYFEAGVISIIGHFSKFSGFDLTFL